VVPRGTARAHGSRCSQISLIVGHVANKGRGRPKRKGEGEWQSRTLIGMRQPGDKEKIPSFPLYNTQRRDIQQGERMACKGVFKRTLRQKKEAKKAAPLRLRRCRLTKETRDCSTRGGLETRKERRGEKKETTGSTEKGNNWGGKSGERPYRTLLLHILLHNSIEGIGEGERDWARREKAINF